jgi:hypothetical protein
VQPGAPSKIVAILENLITEHETSYIQIISANFPALCADPGKLVTLLIHLLIPQGKSISGKHSKDKRLTLREEFLALINPSVRKLFEERPINGRSTGKAGLANSAITKKVEEKERKLWNITRCCKILLRMESPSVSRL